MLHSSQHIVLASAGALGAIHECVTDLSGWRGQVWCLAPPKAERPWGLCGLHLRSVLRVCVTLSPALCTLKGKRLTL